MPPAIAPTGVEEEEEEDEVEDGEADKDVESEPVDTVATFHVSG